MKITKAQAVKVLKALKFVGVEAWDAKKMGDKLSVVHKAVSGKERLPDDETAKLFKAIVAAGKKNEKVEVTEAVPAKADASKAANGKPAPKGKAKAAAEDDDDEDDDEESEESDDDEEESDEGDDESEGDDEEEGDDDEETEESAAPPAKKGKDKGKPAPGKKDGKEPKKAAPKKEKAEVDRFGCRVDTRAARLNAAISKTPKTAKEIADEANYDKPIHNHLRFLMERDFIIKTEDGKYRTKPAEGDKKVEKKKVKK